MKIASTTTTTALFAATALLAAFVAPDVEAVCATPLYGPCGSKAAGVSCCPSGFYCQPWAPEYYQCMPQPDQCSKQSTDVGYLGNDLQTLFGIQPGECCKRCAETAGCKGYTFVNSRPGQPACYLKSAIGKKTKLIGGVSGIVNNPKPKLKIRKSGRFAKNNKSGGNNMPNCPTRPYNGCGNSNNAACCPTGQYCQPWSPQYYQCMDAPQGCPSQLTDTDYYGNDLIKLPLGSPGECCDACKRDSRCKAYTFINYDNNGPACYLKSAAGNAQTKKGAVSGKKA